MYKRQVYGKENSWYQSTGLRKAQRSTAAGKNAICHTAIYGGSMSRKTDLRQWGMEETLFMWIPENNWLYPSCADLILKQKTAWIWLNSRSNRYLESKAKQRQAEIEQRYSKRKECKILTDAYHPKVLHSFSATWIIFVKLSVQPQGNIKASLQ